MTRIFKLFPIDLTAHDGAGAAAGAAAPAPAGDGTAATAGTPSLPGSSRRGNKTGENAPKVLYGKQSEAAPAAGENADPPKSTAATSDAKEARRAEFEKLIDGEYKDFFTERTQQIIDRRFKETKSLQERLDALEPLLDVLGQKYKVEDGDPKKLVDAFEADGKFVEDLADEQGLTVQQFKEMQKLHRENKELKRAQQEQAAQGQYVAWVREAAELQKTYSDFDLRREAANPQFTAMLRSGVPLKAAYEAMHLDDIKSTVAQTVGRQTEQAVTNNIRAKGTRPAEAGASAPSGVIVKSDVSQLTREDRRKIAELARRGETITF